MHLKIITYQTEQCLETANQKLYFPGCSSKDSSKTHRTVIIIIMMIIIYLFIQVEEESLAVKNIGNIGTEGDLRT